MEKVEFLEDRETCVFHENQTRNQRKAQEVKELLR